MPTFSSQDVTSPFPSVNELLAPMTAFDAHANQLLNQQKFELEKSQYAARQKAGQSLLDSVTGTVPPADSSATSGGGGGGGGSFLSALAEIESGDKNIVSGVDTDSQGRTAAQGGNASEISQGHFQIQTATWRDFAKQAGIDINQYPNAMSAPREVQAQVASVIPFSRFGPRTQKLMRDRFGDFDSNQTVGVLAGLGPRVLPAAPGAAPTRQATAPAAPPPQYNSAAGPRIANLPPPASPGSDAAIGAPGGPNITPGMTDQAWLDEMAKRYPTMAGPNDTSQRPNATPAIPTAVRQAATTLLAMPEAEAAVAYGPMVKELQSRGEAMNAPPNYPGHAAVRALAGGDGAPATAQDGAGGPQPPAPYQVASNAPVPPPARGPGYTEPETGLPVAGTLPAIPDPHPLYQTGLPGMTIRAAPLGPTQAGAVAQAPVAPAPVTPPPGTPPPPGANSPPPGATSRPPVLQPPPALPRAIPPKPVLPSGLTVDETKALAALVQGDASPAQIATFMATARQRNTELQHQYVADSAAAEAANYQRQEDYRKARIEAEHTDYQRQQDAETARRNAEADARAAESQRLAQGGAERDTKRLSLEEQKFAQGPDAQSRDDYTLRTSDPSSQAYTDAWARKKWTVAPNGNVIENDVSQYPAPARSIQRPSFLPAPTPQALDEVRKADTDARVIASGIDHYVDVFSATGGKNWGAYFDNPQSPQAQQLLGAFDRLKTVLRSPVYFNTGVLQPAEMAMMKQDLISPESLRGLFATPQALATRLGEIRLAILTRQDAELRSIGKDGVIVRDKADFAKVQEGGKYYDEEGHLRVKPVAQ
jgi:hypothetical protein